MRGSTVSSILILVGAAGTALLVGLLGAYVLLPSMVSSIETSADADQAATSAAPDSTLREDRRSDPVGMSEMNSSSRDDNEERSSSPEATMNDGGEETGASTKQETTTAASTDRPEQDPTDAALIRALRDSIQSLHKRLQNVRQNADTLRQETTRLRQKLATAADDRAKVNELSDALMDMRRRGLSNLLREVDMGVLRKLYKETTGSARTRLLQSMEPARAAKFVNEVVEGEAADSASASPETADPVPASE